MSSPIEKAKELIAKGEKATRGPWALEGDNRYGHRVCSEAARPPYHMVVHADGYVSDNTEGDAAYIAAANPEALLPVLRLLVECEHWIDGVCELIETSDLVPTGEPRLVEEAQGGRALLDKLRSES